MPVYGDGLNVRDWLFVEEDHARALTLVRKRGRVGETYNIGGRSECTNRQVVAAICDLIDELQPSPAGARRRLIAYVADRPGHDRRYAIDPTKIETELGWRPTETFGSELAKTVRWYCQNRTWWQDILDGGYRTNRIGLNAKPFDPG